MAAVSSRSSSTSKVRQAVGEIEAKHIAPLRDKVAAIMADVKTVTARVSQQTSRVDQAISGTMDRVDETAERLGHSVRTKVSQATGVVRGIRAVVASVFSGAEEANGRPPASVPGSEF